MSSNVKGLEGALNQEKALLEGAFFMIVKTDGSFAALAEPDEGRCTVLYCTALYCTWPEEGRCTVLYCTVLYCTALHCTVPGLRRAAGAGAGLHRGRGQGRPLVASSCRVM